MSNRKIKISILADAKLAAMRDTSREAAKMAEAVGRANDQMRQATLRSAAERIESRFPVMCRVIHGAALF